MTRDIRDDDPQLVRIYAQRGGGVGRVARSNIRNYRGDGSYLKARVDGASCTRELIAHAQVSDDGRIIERISFVGQGLVGVKGVEERPQGESIEALRARLRREARLIGRVLPSDTP